MNATQNTYWVAGCNVPGYLPEADPFVTDDLDEARRYLIAEMLFQAEWCDFLTEADRTDLTLMAELVNLSSGETTVIAGGTAWFIAPTTADHYAEYAQYHGLCSREV